MKTLFIILCSLFLFACNKPDESQLNKLGIGSPDTTQNTNNTPTEVSSSSLHVIKGNNQVLEQNQQAPNRLEVMVLNSLGQPVSNLEITFELLTENAGVFSNNEATYVVSTGSNGRAHTEFTASSQLGPVSVLARSTAGSAVFQLSVGVLGVGASLNISGGNGQVLSPSTKAPIDLEVIATSPNGSVLSGIPITFTVITANGGILSNSQSLYVTSTNNEGKASTEFFTSMVTGPVSILASSSIGTVNFSLNSSTGAGGGGGGSSGVIFNPESLSPPSTNWLNAEAGSSPQKTVTVTNSFNTPIFVNSIFTTSATPFSIVNDTCPRSPASLETAASCTITLRFLPLTAETVSRFLFLNWSVLNDGSNGQNAVLILEGSGPPSLTFAGIDQITDVTINSMRLNWQPATGAVVTMYRVYRINDGSPTLITTLAPNINQYDISGLTPNTSYTYRVRAINTAGEEDGNIHDVTQATDTVTVPFLSNPGHFTFPTQAIKAGVDTLIVDIDNELTGDDTGMSYQCRFSRVVTGVLIGKINCSQASLGGVYSFNAATGELSWGPPLGLQGVFEFVITGTDQSGAGYRYFTVNVAHPYSTVELASLLADFRSSFSNLSIPYAGPSDLWKDTSGNNNHASITGGGAWQGATNNTFLNPHRFHLTRGAELNLGPVLSGYNNFMIDFWMSNPELSWLDGSTVMRFADNADPENNSLIVTQKTLPEGKPGLRFDFLRKYSPFIHADFPTFYWRMDETSGTTITDEVSGLEATFGGAGITHSMDGATQGEKSSTAISFHTQSLNLPNHASLKPAGAFSIEMWIKYPQMEIPADHHLYTFHTAGTAQGLQLSMIGGVLTAKYKPANGATFTLTPILPGTGHIFDGQWHHVVFTSMSNHKTLYVDGVVLSASFVDNGHIAWPATPDEAFLVGQAPSGNPVILDEVVFYSYVLTPNKVKNHLSYGDHFVRNQALFPANAIKQTRPLAYWRYGESGASTYPIAKDSSGNHFDLVDWTNATTGTFYNRPGVYMRTGGSNLDTSPSVGQNGSSGYVNVIGNNQLLKFGTKLSFATWLNFASNSTETVHLFSSHNYANNWYGIVAQVNNNTGKLCVYFDNPHTSGSNFQCTMSAILPNTGNGISLGWYHVAMTFDGTQTVANRIKFYVNGTPVKMDSPSGTIPTSLSSLLGSGLNNRIGTSPTSNRRGENINFAHDEDALWNYVLTAQEIRAQANEASLRFCEIETITADLIPVYQKPFNYFNFVYDGTTFNVRHNAKHVCSLRPAANFSGQNNELIFGKEEMGYEGLLADLRIHGDSASAIENNQNLAHKSYLQTLDQHSPVKMGKIVSDELVRAYEASSAFDGVRPHTSGCPLDSLQWQDIGHIAGSAEKNEPGNLMEFSSCATIGWRGEGTPDDAYRLNFNGTTNWVDLGTEPLYRTSPNSFSACSWVRTIKTGDYPIFIRSAVANSANWGTFSIGVQSSRLWISINQNAANGSATVNDSNIFLNGQWHYICGTYNGTHMGLYMDGKQLLLQSTAQTTLMESTSWLNRMSLGRNINHFYGTGYYGTNGSAFQGDIGAVHIYNKGLSASEVLQNCRAQAANYGVTCNP